MANYWGNYAYENDIIMVFPQATHCFMGDVAKEGKRAEENQVSRGQGMMKFMKGIVDRATT